MSIVGSTSVPQAFRFSCISAEGLPDYDKEMGANASDPYVTFAFESAKGELLGAAVRTATISNSRFAQWNDMLMLEVPSTIGPDAKLRVNVLDEDSSKSEVMGTLTVDLSHLLAGQDAGKIDRATITSTDRGHYSFQLSFSCASAGSEDLARFQQAEARKAAERAKEQAASQAAAAAAAEAAERAEEAAARGVAERAAHIRRLGEVAAEAVALVTPARAAAARAEMASVMAAEAAEAAYNRTALAQKTVLDAEAAATARQKVAEKRAAAQAKEHEDAANLVSKMDQAKRRADQAAEAAGREARYARTRAAAAAKATKAAMEPVAAAIGHC